WLLRSPDLGGTVRPLLRRSNRGGTNERISHELRRMTHEMRQRAGPNDALPPSPGGGGAAHMSEAKCEPGWGDGLSASNSARVERSPHPDRDFIAIDPPPPGEGEERALRRDLSVPPRQPEPCLHLGDPRPAHRNPVRCRPI